jgi:lipoate-protein ligase A
MEGYAEKKLPGEKLVCIDIIYSDRIEKLRITGDFFMHPEGLVVDLEKALEGVPLSMNDMELRDIITNVVNSRNAEMIGISAKGIITAIRDATSRQVL